MLNGDWREGEKHQSQDNKEATLRALWRGAAAASDSSISIIEVPGIEVPGFSTEVTFATPRLQIDLPHSDRRDDQMTMVARRGLQLYCQRSR
jgi:hypothetical protein